MSRLCHRAGALRQGFVRPITFGMIADRLENGKAKARWNPNHADRCKHSGRWQIPKGKRLAHSKNCNLTCTVQPLRVASGSRLRLGAPIFFSPFFCLAPFFCSRGVGGEEGRKEGKKAGRKQGRKEGREEGREEARKERRAEMEGTRGGAPFFVAFFASCFLFSAFAWRSVFSRFLCFLLFVFLLFLCAPLLVAFFACGFMFHAFSSRSACC